MAIAASLALAGVVGVNRTGMAIGGSPLASEVGSLGNKATIEPAASAPIATDADKEESARGVNGVDARGSSGDDDGAGVGAPLVGRACGAAIVATLAVAVEADR